MPLSRQRRPGWIPVEALRHALTKKGESPKGERRKIHPILHPSSCLSSVGAGCARFWGRGKGYSGAGRRRPAVGFGAVAATLGVERLQKSILLPIARVDGRWVRCGRCFTQRFRGTTGRSAHLPRRHHSCDWCAGTDAGSLRRRRGYGVSATSRLAQGGGVLRPKTTPTSTATLRFQFIDHRGRHGKCSPRRMQHASCLTATHLRCKPARAADNIKVNARLADLVTWGAGNGRKRCLQRFWRSGKATIRACAETDERRTLLILTVTEHPTSYKLWHSRE